MWLNHCHLMFKAERMKSCFLRRNKKKQFLEKESTLRKDAVNSAEMTIKDLEYSIDLDENAVARFVKIKC